jgi:hypothetical protein
MNHTTTILITAGLTAAVTLLLTLGSHGQSAAASPASPRYETQMVVQAPLVALLCVTDHQAQRVYVYDASGEEIKLTRAIDLAKVGQPMLDLIPPTTQPAKK